MRTVNFQIRVPSGDHCVELDSQFVHQREICEHFDNTGGHPTCGLGLSIEYDKNGHVQKGNGCLSAEVVSNE